MPFDIAGAFAQRHGESFSLHERFLNRQLSRVLKTVGFDRCYVRGEGCYLYDDEGHRYLDFLSGFGVYALGRAHPGVKAALHGALDLDLPNMVQLDCALLPGLLAEDLVRRSHPGIGKVFFCNSGAEAVEAAIKFARHATGRSKIAYAEHAFHGLTTGALAINGASEFRAGFGPLLADCVPVPFGNLEALYRQLRGNDVAAFIVEPIQGKGILGASDDYWGAAQELCRRHGALLVTDEVQTGLGRTGKFFCHEHWGLEPDIITVSKALSGGYVPVGAMLSTDRVFSSVYRSMADAMKHSSTFGRNQLAMTAGLATLAAFDDEDITGNAARTGHLLREALAPLVERYELLHSIRGMGLMVGLEFGEPNSPALRRMFRAIEQVRPGLFSQLVVLPLFHRHRIITQVAADHVNVIKLLPPLIAGRREVEYFVNALDDVLADLHRGYRLVPELAAIMARGALAAGTSGVSDKPRWAWPGRTTTAPPARPQASAEVRTSLVPAGKEAAGSEGYRLKPGDRVVVTGASGFIGSAVVRALQTRGADVIALVEPGTDDRNLRGTGVQRAAADIRDADAVRECCEGARFVFHLAAVYRFFAPAPQLFYDVNVTGTRNVLAGAYAAGCQRLVYTSTVGVLGLNGSRPGGLADETSYAEIGHLYGPYKQTKYVAEHEVLRAAAEGLDVSLALPTFPLGPGDVAPTPTGKVVLDFLNGHMPAFADTAMNVLHVDDLASGHIAVLERGKRGRSYILGGENRSMRSMLEDLSDCTGLPMPRFVIPRELALGVGIASDLVEGRLLGREPRVPLEAARMSTTKMIFNDERARRELGHCSRPAREAIEDSARWFADHGYVAADRCAAIKW